MLDTANSISLRSGQSPVYSTLLQLVQSLLDANTSEHAAVDTAIDLVNSGRGVLIGTFSGCRLERQACERQRGAATAEPASS